MAAGPLEVLMTDIDPEVEPDEVPDEPSLEPEPEPEPEGPPLQPDAGAPQPGIYAEYLEAVRAGNESDPANGINPLTEPEWELAGRPVR